MQLWLNDQELGDFFGLSAEKAREKVVEAGWTRRKCSDGVTWVQLPPATAHTYLLQFALSAEAEDHVSALRDILEEVSGRKLAYVA